MLARAFGKKAADAVHDLRNLAYAKYGDGLHGSAYAKAVAKNLRKAEKDAIKNKGKLEDYVTDALNVMRDILEKGGKFW